jgi:hypothetical protein
MAHSALAVNVPCSIAMQLTLTNAVVSYRLPSIQRTECCTEAVLPFTYAPLLVTHAPFASDACPFDTGACPFAGDAKPRGSGTWPLC